MACERNREALADVAAGAPAAAGLESHLASCAGCREELAALRRALAVADAELASLLSAEPSPGLEARIRRGAAEPSPAWRFGWLWPAAAAAAALLVALAVWFSRPSPPPRLAAEAGRQGPAGVAAPSSPEASPAPRDDRVVAVVHRRRPAPAPAVPARAAEILVGPGEAEALVRFAAFVRRRAVEPDSLLVADLEAPLAEPTAIEIRSLEIVPLDPAETPGTD